MATIKLTDVERLILANQYEILSKLSKDDTYALWAEALRDGHEFLYSQCFERLSPNLSEQKTQHVLDILSIYRALRLSYEKLTDKSGIDASDIEFIGFDGNNESDLYGFALALAKSGRFTESLGEYGKNSHSQTTDIYERMIQRWRELGKPNAPYSRKTIEEILAAQIHPSNRK